MNNDPAENAYLLIVGNEQLTKKHAIDMFKAGVASGRSGEVELYLKEDMISAVESNIGGRTNAEIWLNNYKKENK